ncbi:hypothetical protein ScPMuIL_014889 [Solemya velum]
MSTSKQDVINDTFAKNLFQFSQTRVPGHSRLHPVIPRLYVPEWKTDMKNRRIITKNAALGGVPNFEHDENLFLDKREQLSYNIEDRHRVDAKVRKVTRKELLNPPFYHEASRFQSELMYRMDNPEEQLLPDN